MNFEDEDYVRLYTRDTVTWELLGWEGHCVLTLMLRGKFDRAGVFVTGSHDLSRAVTAATNGYMSGVSVSDSELAGIS